MIQQFLSDLESYGAPYVFNPWRQSAGDDRLVQPSLERRQRLQTHLLTQRPKILLIGQSASYRGSRITGVPLTSEALLYAGSVPCLAIENRLSSFNLPWSNDASTTIWQALHSFNLADKVIAWNAFPFHPYHQGNPLTNRKLVASEQHDGLVFLETLLKHYHGIYPVALGKIAGEALNQLSVASYTVLRHPSRGGACHFRKGLATLANQFAGSPVAAC